MFSVRKIIILLVFSFGFLGAQDQIIDVKLNQELRKMSQNSTTNARKYYRQFKRLMNSQFLSDVYIQQINHVLNNFDDRKMRFNDSYVPFFQFVLKVLKYLLC